jgi:hypothetical protein
VEVPEGSRPPVAGIGTAPLERPWLPVLSRPQGQYDEQPPAPVPIGRAAVASNEERRASPQRRRRRLAPSRLVEVPQGVRPPVAGSGSSAIKRLRLSVLPGDLGQPDEQLVHEVPRGGEAVASDEERQAPPRRSRLGFLQSHLVEVLEGTGPRLENAHQPEDKCRLRLPVLLRALPVCGKQPRAAATGPRSAVAPDEKR